MLIGEKELFRINGRSRLIGFFTQIQQRKCTAKFVDRFMAQAPDKFHKYALGSFVVGTSNFKKHALTVHSESEGHTDEVRKFWVRNVTEPGETEAEKCLASLNKADIDRLNNLLCNAYVIALNSRSFRDFV
ncbi:hypothetical protein KUTeg_011820 [Tegillarca granosa]|uniref:Uncharacterized protein n=1 Tax=Tegillarca granosa TaxID=220873 RepID=A0ABQ9F1D5_TEGGR|nr:hypothetical protein KUTeg_011820 [Tegillarca granosa]